MLASRLSSISESKSVATSNRAAELVKAGKRVYNFGIGEPDFVTPEHIIKAAFDAAMNGKTHYTSSYGIIELREAIAEKMKSVNGVKATAKNVLVTPTKFSLNLAVMSLLNPGDEAILPEPYYLSYPDILRLHGAKVLPSPTDENYSFDLDDMRKITTPRTKMVIISNPTNPTGRVYSEKEIRELCDFVLENNMYLLSDEIYEDLIFEGKMFSPASMEEMFDRTITVNGFSKSHAMTGWRVGYMVANESIIKASNKIQQQTITCAPSVSQYASLAAVKDMETPKKFKEAFRRRRDLVHKLISESSSLSVRKPDGTFYAFVKYQGDEPSDSFAERLLNEKLVVVTPGSAFGQQGEYHFRLSFATDDETITEGISRIREFAE